ncbi:hypothetical protein BJF81_07750 [Ornithinimicrobium sp. CNJ-824]|uniref:hypothetical protein n=1 Tax=Ornithinimicrobium sp. CNJ-824 TaxID=1904966 RepID=UPI00095CE18C|nr:hypothetical protein [Ornithinimicrobium sp. CNJ-824]OLT19648.1 hypothetical protein BJF81_07750 [Ornithinimicrobium sp. CNJ-824]
MTSVDDLLRTDHLLDALGQRRAEGCGSDPAARALLALAVDVDPGPAEGRAAAPTRGRTGADRRPAVPVAGPRRPTGRRRWLGGASLAAALIAGSSLAAAVTSVDRPGWGTADDTSAVNVRPPVATGPSTGALAPVTGRWSLLPPGAADADDAEASAADGADGSSQAGVALGRGDGVEKRSAPAVRPEEPVADAAPVSTPDEPARRTVPDHHGVLLAPPSDVPPAATVPALLLPASPPQEPGEPEDAAPADPGPSAATQVAPPVAPLRDSTAPAARHCRPCRRIRPTPGGPASRPSRRTRPSRPTRPCSPPSPCRRHPPAVTRHGTAGRQSRPPRGVPPCRTRRASEVGRNPRPPPAVPNR